MSSSSGDMSFWMDMYLEMVNLMLNMVHFQQIGNWNDYLQALAEFLPYCFSLSRHNCARNLSYYHMQMLNLQNSNLDLLHHIQEQGFTVSLSGLPHSTIPCDQVIEMAINRSSKDTGGLSGKTDVGASERWMRINHIMATFREHLDALIRTRSWNKHDDLGRKRMLSDENDVATLSECLTEWMPNLRNPDQPLINIATAQRASEEIVDNVRACNKRSGGNEAV